MYWQSQILIIACVASGLGTASHYLINIRAAHLLTVSMCHYHS